MPTTGAANWLARAASAADTGMWYASATGTAIGKAIASPKKVIPAVIRAMIERPAMRPTVTTAAVEGPRRVDWGWAKAAVIRCSGAGTR